MYIPKWGYKQNEEETIELNYELYIIYSIHEVYRFESKIVEKYRKGVIV